MASVRAPYFKVVYDSVDITEEISKDVIELTYSDNTENEASELVILLDDMFGKWKNEWIVNTGVTIQVELGWSSDSALDCGTFEVDEIHYRGDYASGDRVEIRALSISENSVLREKRSYIYAEQTIQQIVDTVAARNELTLADPNIGIDGNITTNPFTISQQDLIYRNKVLGLYFSRIIQDREDDLCFLDRLLSNYGISVVFHNGFIFLNVNISDRSGWAVNERLGYFTREDIPDGQILVNGELVNLTELATIKSYMIKNCAAKTLSGLTLKYHDPYSDAELVYDAEWGDLPTAGRLNPLGVDMDIIDRRAVEYGYVENIQQAEIVAKAKLFEAISKQVEGTFEMEGQPTVVAGTAVEISGIGKLSGRYFVNQSRHRINRAGYTTNIEGQMLASTS